MNGTSEAIKNLIETSPRVLIAFEPSASEAQILASHALKEILKGAGKEIFLWPEPPISFLDKFSKIVVRETNFDLPQKIKIKIPKSVALEELRYEDEGENLSVIISPKTKLEPDSIIIEKAPYEMDAAFLFLENEGDFEKMNAPVKNPAREKIVFFTEPSKTCAEKVDEIKKAINPEAMLGTEAANMLFASLACETHGFRKNSGAGVFALASSLISSGADRKIIDEILDSGKTVEEAQLLGRALARTTVEEMLKSSWTFLTLKDFEKTKTLPAEEKLISLIPKIRAALTEETSSILCFENASGVCVLFESRDKNIRNRVAGHFGLAGKNSVLFIPGFKHFSEAENKMRQLLKEFAQKSQPQD